MSEPLSIFWFRRDLRSDDNHALYEALTGSYPVIPVFIFDTDILNKLQDNYDARVNFIYHKISELNNQFRKKHRSSILIKNGRAVEMFAEILNAYDVKAVYANHDYEPAAIQRDREVADYLSTKGVQLKTFKDQVVFEKNEVVKSDGKPYSVFTPYSKTWKSIYKGKELPYYNSENYLHNLQQEKHDFPVLEGMGFKPLNIDYPPANIPEKTIRDYDQYRDVPAMEGTTRLGIHLRFGSISIRKLVKKAEELNSTFLDQLIWREFYMMILYYHPRVVDKEFKPQYSNIPWRVSESDYHRWRDGYTGFPIVDAGMRQLNETGYMHNRVRMITASFLTKHLLIDWRWGEAWFAEKLLDYELASNNGNWQWAAGSGCDAAPYFRIFNPETQIKKFDLEQKYIKKWVKDYSKTSYPKKMVDHRKARIRALDTYKTALNKRE